MPVWLELIHDRNLYRREDSLPIAGSGRSTDAVLDIRAGAISSNQALQEIASKGKIVRFEIDSSPEQFARVIESRIGFS